MAYRLSRPDTLIGFGSLLLAIVPFFVEGAKMNIWSWILVVFGIVLVTIGIFRPSPKPKDITEQPNEKTARISLHKQLSLTERKLVRIYSRKQIMITPRVKRITPPMPSLSQIKRMR